jgi:hypothetical protein
MSLDRSVEQEPQFAAFVGVDWADQKHVWSLQGAGSQKRESGELEHAPEAVEFWVAQLCQRFAKGPIAVALEQSRGSLVFMLSKYERLHLFPVPSTMAGNMRDALYPSGAKDDPRDADLLLDLLLKHRDKLRRLSPDTEATRRVQNLVEERRKLVDEKTEQTNRLTSHLKIYFPQMLDWFDRLDREAACALLERWPTLEELQKAPPAKLRTFFCKHHCREDAACAKLGDRFIHAGNVETEMMVAAVFQAIAKVGVGAHLRGTLVAVSEHLDAEMIIGRRRQIAALALP